MKVILLSLFLAACGGQVTVQKGCCDVVDPVFTDMDGNEVCSDPAAIELVIEAGGTRNKKCAVCDPSVFFRVIGKTDERLKVCI